MVKQFALRTVNAKRQQVGQMAFVKGVGDPQKPNSRSTGQMGIAPRASENKRLGLSFGSGAEGTAPRVNPPNFVPAPDDGKDGMAATIHAEFLLSLTH